jgi:hypothetical protein
MKDSYPYICDCSESTEYHAKSHNYICPFCGNKMEVKEDAT